MIEIATTFLRNKKACPSGTEAFARVFPCGYVCYNKEEFIADCAAYASTFDFWWASRHLLSGETLSACKERTDDAYLKYNHNRLRYLRERAKIFAELFWEQEHQQ